MKRKTLLILISVFLTGTIFSQETKTDTTPLISNDNQPVELKKNALYLTGGTLGSSFGFINGSYERMIWGNKNPVMRSIFARISLGTYKGEALVGVFSSSDVKATTYMITVGGLVGKRSSFLEFSLGFMYGSGTETRTSWWSGNTYTYEYHEFVPTITLGYRYQKDHFVFRAGIGFYEFYYISLGFCL